MFVDVEHNEEVDFIARSQFEEFVAKFGPLPVAVRRCCVNMFDMYWFRAFMVLISLVEVLCMVGTLAI